MKKQVFAMVCFFELLNLLPNELYTQWTQLISNPDHPFMSICFCNSNTGLISANRVNNAPNINFLRTTNAGNDWQEINIPTNFVFFDIYFVNCNTVFAVGNGGSIVRSTNSGQNWSFIGAGTNVALHSIQFVNDYTGFIAGNNSTLRYSSDAGITWLNRDYNLICDYIGLHFINSTTGTVVGRSLTNTNILIKTTNGGLNWINQNPGTTQYLLYDVHFLNDNTGIIAGDNGIILRTVNGGNNWSVINAGTTLDLRSIFVSDPNNIWIAGEYLILKSTDTGFSWFQQYSNNSIYLYDIFLSDLNTGYATGMDFSPIHGIALKTTNSGVTFVNNIKEEPIDFTLYQNYPNPFNPITKIKFELPYSKNKTTKGNITLKIYDTTGEEIAIIFKGKLTQGVFETEWDASNFPSGIYLYALEIYDSGSNKMMTYTKKMVLIK